MWKNLFFFSKGERQGILILLCLVGMMFSINFCLPRESAADKAIIQEIASYRDTLFIHDTIIRYTPSNSTAQRQTRKESTPKSSFNYDTVRVEINRADTTELKRLRGIGSILSQRIIKYRKRLGKFNSVEQLREVYGLSEETYQAILPHVWIED